MARSSQLAELFRCPTLVSQRNYEICKAYYTDGTPAEQLAERFGLHPDSIRAIVRDFAADPDLQQFFVVNRPGRQAAPKGDAVREDIVGMRREGLTLLQIQGRLQERGQAISESYLSRLLAGQGLAGQSTPRPRPADAPARQASDGSDIPPAADARSCSFEAGRCLQTEVAGLFLFVPLLLALDFPAAVAQAHWPGSAAIPALQAILALLSGKLLGRRRISHINDLCNDEGAGLFCGLNVLPKATFATDYCYRTERAMSERFLKALLDKASLCEGPASFNLDFHAIPYRGEESDLEKHWLARANRAGASIMVFVAQHRGSRVMCYATANVVRDDMDAMAVRFAEHWKEQTGHYPEQLLFDSRVTTYEHLAELEQRQVGFITVRRRGCAMLRRVGQLAQSDWQTARLSQAKGVKRDVQYVDEQVKVTGYPDKLRQLIVKGLGREEPTFFLTNDRPKKLTARQVVQEYAQRNLVENGLGEQITFFHLDCLNSDVRLNADFDLTLTVVADLLYRELGQRLKGFAQASPQTLFRKFVDTMGRVQIDEDKVTVRLAKRAHNPLLKEAALTEPTAPVPWLGNRSLLIQLP